MYVSGVAHRNEIERNSDKYKKRANGIRILCDSAAINEGDTHAHTFGALFSSFSFFAHWIHANGVDNDHFKRVLTTIWAISYEKCLLAMAEQ